MAHTTDHSTSSNYETTGKQRVYPELATRIFLEKKEDFFFISAEIPNGIQGVCIHGIATLYYILCYFFEDIILLDNTVTIIHGQWSIMPHDIKYLHQIIETIK